MNWCTPRRAAGSPLAALALLWAAAASAEDAFPLRAVEFEGNREFSAGELASVTGLEVGAPVRKRDFDLAMRRLNETGMFEDLRYRFEPQDGGYRLTVTVRELPEMFPVYFEGFDAPDEEVEGWLRSKLALYSGSVPGGGPAVRMIVSLLQSWWEERGGEEEVVADLVPSGEGFTMRVGPEQEISTIAFVRFSNTGDVNALELQRVFNQAAVGEPYSDARLRELLHYNARPLFTELGYMDVEFCPCEVQPDPDTEGLLVDVRAEQGDVYTFGTLAWPEPLPIDPDSLEKVNRIAEGQVVNMKAAYATMAAISERLQRQGYMQAQATFDERLNPEARTVDLDIEIAPGRQYVFSRLIIHGLDILSEPAVRKRWGMQSGEPFDLRYPAYFLDRIRADAMFENLKRTSWSIDTDEVNGRVDVALSFHGLADEETPLAQEELDQPFD